MALRQPTCSVNEKGLYVLHTQYVYWYKEQRITVPKGFVWDGASIPRGFQTISGIRKDRWIRAAALIHDFLYRTNGQFTFRMIRRTLTRKQADTIFYTMMREAGMPWRKAIIAYWTVRGFGGAAWRHHAKRGFQLEP